MGKLTIKSNQIKKLNSLIEKEIGNIFAETIRESGDLLFKEAEILANQIEGSTEFLQLHTTLVGEFGFTPSEVQGLSDIFSLLIPGTDSKITRVKVKSSPRSSIAVLDWVDFNNLKKHPLAQHDLTRFNRKTKTWELTERVSWVEWLEEGATIRGYFFNDKAKISRRTPPSRSGEGIMNKRPGGLWAFQPTKIFQKTANKFNTNNFKKGFGLLIKKRNR